MRRDLRRLVPHGREPLDEIAGRHDLDAALAHELDRAGVDARRHREWRSRASTPSPRAAARRAAAQARFELLASGIPFGRPGQMSERVRSMAWTRPRGSPVAGIR